MSVNPGRKPERPEYGWCVAEARNGLERSAVSGRVTYPLNEKGQERPSGQTGC